jgi:hypothetical protein
MSLVYLLLGILLFGLLFALTAAVGRMKSRE